jgi:hypothetical protein
MNSILKRIVQPLRSRKVRVALATVLATYLADWGLNVGPEVLTTIVGVGVALILGIAHEDNGKKRAGFDGYCPKGEK